MGSELQEGPAACSQDDGDVLTPCWLQPVYDDLKAIGKLAVSCFGG